MDDIISVDDGNSNKESINKEVRISLPDIQTGYHPGQGYLSVKSLYLNNSLLHDVTCSAPIGLVPLVLSTSVKINKLEQKHNKPPWEVGFVNGAWIIGSEAKSKRTVPRTACISNADVNTFADADRPAAETNALNTINSFGTAAVVRKANVNAVCSVKQHRPTTQRRYAQLICAVVTCSQTQCIASLRSHVHDTVKVDK